MTPITVARWRPGEPSGPLRAMLERGGILAIPTESSYGLGADPRNEKGVRAVFELKRRDGRKPLPVVVAGPQQLAEIGVDAAAPEVAPFLGLWPAPLSVVAPLRLALPAAAGETSVAVRVPDHAGLRELLRAVGPLTATSANLAGEPPILDPQGCVDLLTGADAIVVDGGQLPGGAPSTLVALRHGTLRVLRTGRYPVAEVARRISAVAVENPVERPC
ncbi:MAG: L-threonylcarbamoyladenylate synthase [Acidobacteriota bacterium]